MTGFALETPRLRLTRLGAADAAFIQELLNEPAFLKNIGDRNARDHEGVMRYIDARIEGYAKNGFGLYRVALKDGDVPVGMCGLVRRDGLDLPDVGYAILERHWGQGYATESARAVLEHAQRDLGLTRLAAVTSPGNLDSIRVLLKLGFTEQGMIQLPAYPDGSLLLLWNA